MRLPNLIVLTRITSYNVCYTKLLRNVDLNPDELLDSEMLNEKVVRHVIKLSSCAEQAIEAIENEDKFTEGHAFDGSSIAGWKGIQASDMLLMPDPSTANIDPFFDEATLILTCDVT